ncbi:hypothetical protein ABTY61_02145 [Kitasatospora sp. NPDC096128]|uniref:hypothetical protein n=1 Tax=Kitasatospora sp. NPDC096128 TaxID=3155547 RepID=UPI0033203566
MTHRIARSIAGALVALLAAVGLSAAASSATAVAAPRTAASSTAVAGAAAAVPVPVAVAVAQGAPEQQDAHIAAKTEKKKSGFFAKLGKFLLVVVILIILFIILVIWGIVHLVRKLFRRR